MGGIWREYSRADKRWQIRDPNIISVEILTVLVGVACLFQLYGILKQSSWRYLSQAIICVCELYGGWMTFAPEWVEGNPNLDGSSASLLWIYLVFMNGLWVVVPAFLLWESIAVISEALYMDKKINSKVYNAAPTKSWYYLIAGFLAAYMVLVPAVLMQAAPIPAKL